MTNSPPGINVPRSALSLEEAALALGISLTLFQERVVPYIRTVRIGRRRVVPVAELDRFLGEDHGS